MLSDLPIELLHDVVSYLPLFEISLLSQCNFNFKMAIEACVEVRKRKSVTRIQRWWRCWRLYPFTIRVPVISGTEKDFHFDLKSFPTFGHGPFPGRFWLHTDNHIFPISQDHIKVLSKYSRERKERLASRRKQKTKLYMKLFKDHVVTEMKLKNDLKKVLWEDGAGHLLLNDKLYRRSLKFSGK